MIARMLPKFEDHKGEAAQADLEKHQRFVGITLEYYARLFGLSKTTFMNIECVVVQCDGPRVLLESVKRVVEPLGTSRPWCRLRIFREVRSDHF